MTNIEMECFVFKSRVFIGTIAAAGIFAAGAAAPAMATTPAKHPIPPIQHVIGAVTAPVSRLGSTLGGVANGNPAGGLLTGLAGLPIIGPLLDGLLGMAPGTMSGGPAMGNPWLQGGGNPVAGILHGVTSAVPGLGTVTGAVNSAVGGLKTLPVVGSITGMLPGVGSITGALSGITSAVPGVGSITSALPALRG
jgi:hypothetical protein